MLTTVKAKLFTRSNQHIKIADATLTKAKIVTYNQIFHTQFFDQQIFNKDFSWLISKSGSKVNTQQLFDFSSSSNRILSRNRLKRAGASAPRNRSCGCGSNVITVAGN
ncbi:hypothetical protein PEC18_37575 [Paucibacter sp. O1-1]|nr:hypothetical protein [Paucibacter sp. O1-1]MDA3831355.1 hypothetical protein [Paucibacter sp. O1-1]